MNFCHAWSWSKIQFFLVLTSFFYEAFMTLATDILHRIPKEKPAEPTTGPSSKGGFNLDEYKNQFNNSNCC